MKYIFHFGKHTIAYFEVIDEIAHVSVWSIDQQKIIYYEFSTLN